VTDTRGIDRFFDAVDSLVDKTDRVLNRTKYVEDKHKARRAEAIDGKQAKKPAPSTAVASRRFRIIEATDAQSGDTIFVVTDGSARAECSTRELAEKILRAVETTP
jgi:hypothetical protein